MCSCVLEAQPFRLYTPAHKICLRVDGSRGGTTPPYTRYTSYAADAGGSHNEVGSLKRISSILDHRSSIKIKYQSIHCVLQSVMLLFHPCASSTDLQQKLRLMPKDTCRTPPLSSNQQSLHLSFALRIA